jgi:hypothetical protein
MLNFFVKTTIFFLKFKDEVITINRPEVAGYFNSRKQVSEPLPFVNFKVDK